MIAYPIYFENNIWGQNNPGEELLQKSSLMQL